MKTIITGADQPGCFRDVIGRWPSTRAFARDAGCSPMLVRQWRHRDHVPARYWLGIAKGAARRGIAAIDVTLLAALAAKRRPEASAGTGAGTKAGTIGA
jgi:hypothetical protein